MVPNWTSKYVARRDHIRSLRSDQQGDSKNKYKLVTVFYCIIKNGDCI